MLLLFVNNQFIVAGEHDLHFPDFVLWGNQIKHTLASYLRYKNVISRYGGWMSANNGLLVYVWFDCVMYNYEILGTILGPVQSSYHCCKQVRYCLRQSKKRPKHYHDWVSYFTIGKIRQFWKFRYVVTAWQEREDKDTKTPPPPHINCACIRFLRLVWFHPKLWEVCGKLLAENMKHIWRRDKLAFTLIKMRYRFILAEFQ